MTLLAPGTHLPSFRLAHLSGASPALFRTGTAFLALFLVCTLLAMVDPRLFNGISTWVKPAKFALSLAVHMLTVAAALLLLPDNARRRLVIRASVAVIIAMALFEQVYIVIRAARAEASHFNTASELARIVYAAMGVGAVAIMLATAAIGWQILRHGGPSLLAARRA